MRYFIAQASIDWSWDRFRNKGPGDFLCHHEWDRIKEHQAKGYIPMWDRNSRRFAWFRIVEKTVDKMGYIVERRGVPSYWRNSIKEVKSAKKA